MLDGELVLWREGRVDFAALQRRLHPATSRARALSVAVPACYVVFDIVAVEGRDVRLEPYSTRRALLEDLLTRQLPPGLVLMPMTTDFAVARTWMLNHARAGVEGVIAKRLAHPYRVNGRTWSKIRTRLTAEAVLGGVVGSLARPEALIVGRYDRYGRFHVAGRTTALSPAARAELLAGVLTPATSGHPWPRVIPSSRFGQLRSNPIAYVQVAPTAVVELGVDTAFEDHRWRHGTRYVRVRAELHPMDLSPLPCDGRSE